MNNTITPAKRERKRMPYIPPDSSRAYDCDSPEDLQVVLAYAFRLGYNSRLNGDDKPLTGREIADYFAGDCLSFRYRKGNELHFKQSFTTGRNCAEWSTRERK